MEVMGVLLPVFGVFIPALLLPGPDFVGVVRSSMTRGTTAGLLTTVGVTIGLGMYATLSMVGLSAVLTQYQWLTWVVRVAGGAYLIYLGIKLLLAKPAAAKAEMARGPVRGSALLMSSAPVMRRFQHARHWIERVAGASFVLIGGRIIADARNPVTP